MVFLGILSNPQLYLRELLPILDDDDISFLLKSTETTELLYPEDEYIKDKAKQADIILSILIDNFYLGTETRNIKHILTRLEPHLADPKICAQIMSTKYYIENTLPFLKHEAKSINNELIDVLGKDLNKLSQLEDEDLSLVSVFLDQRETSAWIYCENLIDAFNNFYRLAKVEERNLLFSTRYNLIAPFKREIIIADPIEQIIVECTKDPSAIFKLTGRQFEKFLAKIFEEFGFEVQLTAKTKDGGADILCMTKPLDIPLKIAVEAKRYKPTNIISVGLVRAFIGAKDSLGANKLVFVTTSRFSKKAIELANSPFHINELELKSLSDIIKWANDYTQRKYPVLKT